MEASGWERTQPATPTQANIRYPSTTALTNYAEAYPLGSPERAARRTPDEKRQDDALLRRRRRLQEDAGALVPLLVPYLAPHMGEVAVRVLAEEFAAAHEHDHARMRGRGRS